MDRIRMKEAQRVLRFMHSVGGGHGLINSEC